MASEKPDEPVRYTPISHMGHPLMQADPHGSWYAHDDYDALRRRCAELEESVNELSKSAREAQAKLNSAERVVRATREFFEDIRNRNSYTLAALGLALKVYDAAMGQPQQKETP